MASRNILILCVLGALVVGLAAAAEGRDLYQRHGYAALLSLDPDQLPGRPERVAFAESQARPLYRRYCADCHGADLRGDTVRGAPNLTDADWLYGEGRVADIEQTLTYGVRSGDPKAHNLSSMPGFGRPKPYDRYAIPPLAPPQIRDIAEYLIAIEGRSADPTAAARGDSLYHGQGGCFDCHGQDARGDAAIGAPNLSDRIWLYGDGSRAGIFTSIAEGRAGACPAWRRQLSAGQIRALALFIHAHAARRPDAPRPAGSPRS